MYPDSKIKQEVEKVKALLAELLADKMTSANLHDFSNEFSYDLPPYDFAYDDQYGNRPEARPPPITCPDLNYMTMEMNDAFALRDFSAALEISAAILDLEEPRSWTCTDEDEESLKRIPSEEELEFLTEREEQGARVAKERRNQIINQRAQKPWSITPSCSRLHTLEEHILEEPRHLARLGALIGHVPDVLPLTLQHVVRVRHSLDWSFLGWRVLGQRDLQIAARVCDTCL
mgnify:CR=1 FL=1